MSEPDAGRGPNAGRGPDAGRKPATEEEIDVDADAVARASADAKWAEDRGSTGLGMRLLDIGPGYGLVAMEVTAEMANSHGIAHGGFVFALADSAFGYACNARGAKAVSFHCAITYLRPARVGERLVAAAHEVALAGRSGIYDVNVSSGDETVAEFRGHSRLIEGRWA